MPRYWVRAITGLALSAAQIAAAPVPASDTFDAKVSAAEAQMLNDPAGARVRAAAAQQLAERAPARADTQTRIATAEWLQGESSIRLNDLDRAKVFIDRALGRLDTTKPTKLLGDLLMSRGALHNVRAEVGPALDDLQRAHNIFATVGIHRSQALALISIGMLYQDAFDHENGLRNYARALEVYAVDPRLNLSIAINRGIAFKELKRFGAAKEQFDKALGLAKSEGNRPVAAQIERNLARMAVDQGNLAEAESAIARGRSIARGDPASSASFGAVAAEVAFRRGQLDTAQSIIDRIFADVDLTTTDLSMQEAHDTAYAVYTALGDAPRALEHLQARKRLDDKVWALRASANTALMAARFDSANQDAKIARLQADAAARQLAMAQAEARYQRTLFGSLAVAAAIVLGLLGFWLWQSRRARIRLTASNAALQKALAAKTEFLATTSHEIRTPLNGILGMAQVMLADQRLDAVSRDRVGIVHSAGLTMRGLVDDILDVAKMETGNLIVAAEPFDLKIMLEDVTRIWAEQARAKGLDFRLELDGCPRGMLGDSGRLRQMIYNLLGNAVKFTAEGSVTLRAGCGSGRLSLAVTDTGIGIPPNKHAEIFESFKQADGGTTRQFGGTGLGLAIVRNIAVAMGGDVSVASSPGAGSTFTIDLPLVPVELSEPEAAKAEGGLLIVERSPIARAMLKAVLEPRADRIVFASDCEDAVARIGAERFDRVLVDEGTARASGGDALVAIAAVADAFEGPVAVLWLNPDEQARTALTQAGVAQVIAKPIAGPALGSALYTCNTQNGIVTRAA